MGISDEDGSPIEFNIKDNRWKALGFQRDDPVSDLRATGLLGLQNLIYFAETHPGLFMSMARNQQQSSEMEYPFATAGINITYLMITLLGLRNPRSWYPSMDTHPLLFYNRHAWEELYTIIFRLFDQKWNQMLVGYMGFQKVIDRTRDDVAGLLKSRNPMGEDVPFIFEMLGILLNDLENFKSDATKKQERASHSFKPVTSPSPPATISPADSPEKPISIPVPTDMNCNTPPTPVKDVDTLNRQCFSSLPTPNSAGWRASTPGGPRPRQFLGTNSDSPNPSGNE